MKRNREDLVLYRSQYIIMITTCLLLYVFHMLFPIIDKRFEAVFTIFVVGTVSAAILAGAILFSPTFGIAKRSIYIVTIVSSFIIAHYLDTQALLILVFCGVLIMLSNFMDKQILVESFVFSQLGMLLVFTTITPLSTFINPLHFIIEEYVYGAIMLLELRTVNASIDIIDKYKDKATAAEETNASKNVFLANMSHEIRTPLNSIKGMSELLGKRNASPIEREYINNIQKSSDDLLALINNILDYAKIESGTMEFADGVYDLSSMINDLVTEINHKIGKKHVALIVEIDPGIPQYLKGDIKRVKQIFENVLDNAVKFTANGSVYFGLRWEKKGKSARIFADITDTGEGIKESNIKKIFDAFSQVDMTKTRRSEGTGLGLSIVKRLVDSMDGDIHILSKEGEGTTVKIEFLQEIADEQPIVHLDEPENIKVFIFEPNRTYLDGIRKALLSIGIKPVIISDEAFAKEIIGDAAKGFVFFDERRGMESFSAIAEEYPGLKFISMYNINGRMPVKENPGVLCLARPITVLSLASVLKNNRGTSSSKNEIRMFSAPDARVMVVDDNETNLRVAEGFLLKYNVNITSVTSGYECIKELSGGKFDIIFMDYMMPNMDGVQTTQIIRNREKDTGNHQTVVALTANAVKGAAEFLISSGMDGYISKPIDSKLLNQIMNKYIPEELKQEYVDETELEEEIKSLNFDTPNIDIEKGIERMGGSRDNYMRILRTAYDECLRSKDRMLSSLKAGDYKNYIILVHSLKSTMLGMGADELSDMAKQHELAGKEGRYDFIEKNLDALTERLELVLGEMKMVLDEAGGSEAEPGAKTEESDAAAASVSKEELSEKLKAAVAALEAFDQEEAAVILTELSGFEFEGRKTVLEAADLVDNIEYDGAIEKLKSIIS